MAGTAFRARPSLRKPPVQHPIPRYCQYHGLIVLAPPFWCHRVVASRFTSSPRLSYCYGGVSTMATASKPAPAETPEANAKPEHVASRTSTSAAADVGPRPGPKVRKYITPALVLLLAA